MLALRLNLRRHYAERWFAADLSTDGFLNAFAIPEYQASDASAYFQQLRSTNIGLCYAADHGYLDGAASGHSSGSCTRQRHRRRELCEPILANVDALKDPVKESSSAGAPKLSLGKQIP
ncbi:hypothetical protein BJV78DRAFT_1151657 [Lactifluus subvellereus]|nr:hypothetical protein BJV78DRAFT_1151657 [Lactifluus subvellereus]